MAYEDARDHLAQFVGVGDKVADCILLFSLGYLEAVPLDTWIQTTIAEFYPECDRGNYADTSRAIRVRRGVHDRHERDAPGGGDRRDHRERGRRTTE